MTQRTGKLPNANVVTLQEGYNGHTMKFFSHPVRVDGDAVKLRCAEPGKEYMIAWRDGAAVQDALAKQGGKVQEAITLNALYKLWDELGNVPVSVDGQHLDADFLHFEKGVETETVWRWFEAQNPRFSVGEVMQGIRLTRDVAGNLSEANVTEPVPATWSDWFNNPFKAIKAATETHGKPDDYQRALEVLRASTEWDEFALDTYLDDLLQEIAGETNIVCQYDGDTASGRRFRATYDVIEEIERSCPKVARHAGDIVGCGSINVTSADEEGFYDCKDCGLFFKGSAIDAIATQPPQRPSVMLQVPVTCHGSSTLQEIVATVQTLIDIGLADANSTLDDKEGDLEAAQKAVELEFGVVQVVPGPMPESM